MDKKMRISSIRPFLPAGRLTGSFIIMLTVAALSGCSNDANKSPSDKAAAPGAQVAVKTTQLSEIKAQPGDPAAGKAVYEQYCHYCHGEKGMGDGPIGIAITPRPADLINDRSRLAKTDEQLFYSITEGIIRATGGKEMAMPRWKDILTEKQRWDVLSYIRRLEKEYGGKGQAPDGK
ncbi:MAG: cytochrome c [Deltaproteobacteria bacterium]|nr:cytochrome c [Deltaproteobacteria bacterium]